MAEYFVCFEAGRMCIDHLVGGWRPAFRTEVSLSEAA